MGLIFADHPEDSWSCAGYLNLLYYGATRLNVDLQAVYLTVRDFASEKMQTYIERCLREGTKDIEQFGYTAQTDSDGKFIFGPIATDFAEMIVSFGANRQIMSREEFSAELEAIRRDRESRKRGES